MFAQFLFVLLLVILGSGHLVAKSSGHDDRTVLPVREEQIDRAIEVFEEPDLPVWSGYSSEQPAETETPPASDWKVILTGLLTGIIGWFVARLRPR